MRADGKDVSFCIELTLEVTCLLVSVTRKGHLRNLCFQLIKDFSVYKNNELLMHNTQLNKQRELTCYIAHLIIFKDGDTIAITSTILSGGHQ